MRDAQHLTFWKPCCKDAVADRRYLALQISVAFDGTMTFSFDEGDTTDDAATLAARLIPDLPDVSSLNFLNAGTGNGADNHGAASFAADFARPASTKAAALHGVSKDILISTNLLHMYRCLN